MTVWRVLTYSTDEGDAGHYSRLAPPPKSRQYAKKNGSIQKQRQCYGNLGRRVDAETTGTVPVEYIPSRRPCTPAVE